MKRFLQAAVLLTFGLVTGLAVAEVAVRVVAPHAKDHVTPAGLFVIDSALGWKLRPGYQRRHSTRFFDVEYTINARGYRDPERATAKNDSVRRLLLFGDSHVFGWGIPLGQRFSDVAAASTANLEVWNMAVPGYGLDQEVLSYIESGDSIAATGAILFMSKVTLERMNYSVLFSKPKPKFHLDSGGRATVTRPAMQSTALTDALYRLLSPFYLPYFVEAQVIRVFGRGYAASLARRSVTPVDSATMSLAKAVLMRAREAAVERHHELYIIAALPPESSADIARFAAANGITFISTGWAAPPTDLMFGSTDHHWIPRLHHELGKRFAPIFAKQPVSTM